MTESTLLANSEPRARKGAKPAVAEHDIAFEHQRPEFHKECHDKNGAKRR
jgi:hypothetical protein